MLGDHASFLRDLASESTLKRALVYAIYHREHSDFFFDPFELEDGKTKENDIVSLLHEELSDLENYTTSPAFAYYPPKNGLCYRRMIYLPFKDLVARYALVTLIADKTNAGLYRDSFANRRATGTDSTRMLLEPFATTSWPRFCNWQKEQARHYKVLLKTDISAFYDSISHESLIHALADILAIPIEGKLLGWFSRLLKSRIFSYSTDSTKIISCEELRQGLCIGNALDGYLANIYLREADAHMERFCSSRKIAYGRYNDDVRIFANTKTEAKEAILLLQQCLLTKGLNLNASKTKFADTKEEIEELISKSYSYLDYEEDYDVETENNPLKESLDQPFDYDDGFSISNQVNNESDAKKFCRCLHKKLKLADRKITQMQQLAIFLEEFPGSTRYACWLLAQTSASEKCSPEARTAACTQIVKVLNNTNISPYAKYRLLHHLTKKRSSGNRFIDKLDNDVLDSIDKLALDFIGAPAFELAIGALYYLWVRGKSHTELIELLHKNAPKPIAVPLQNILLRINERLSHMDLSLEDIEGLSEEEEPDAVPEYY
jgi:hypothetical protein